MEAGVFDVLSSLGLKIGTKTGKNRLIQFHQIVSFYRLSRGDCDVTSRGDGEDAAAHSAVVPCPIIALPTHDRNCKSSSRTMASGVTMRNFITGVFSV